MKEQQLPCQLYRICSVKKILSLVLTTNISTAYLAGKYWNIFRKTLLRKTTTPQNARLAPISTSEDWEVEGGARGGASLSLPAACGLGVSKRDTSRLTVPGAIPCQDQRPGRDRWERLTLELPSSLAGILRPWHFYFLLLYFIFLFFGGKSRETRLKVQNWICVIRT